MMTPTPEQLGQRAVQLGLITERELQAAWAECPSMNVDLDEFTQILIRRELLTNYQIERLKGGNIKGYFYGDYKVLYLVGRGTFARVYRAVTKAGAIVALKVLRKEYSNNPAFCEQFRREGEMGKILQHPNIISIRECFSEGKTNFFVMEFIEGQSLKEFIRVRHKLTPEEALPIMLDIVSGLQFAFEKGFTHRDIKPTNVMITSRGVAKLADFGFATISERSPLYQEGMKIQRTVDYAGLERATGAPNGDPLSDIYFVGCLFYNLLCGESPLTDTKNRTERMNPLRFQEVQSLAEREPDLPKPLSFLVDRAMALDPKLRYPSMADLLKEVKRLHRRFTQKSGGSSIVSLLPVKQSATTQSVMLVENDPRTQEVFRNALKKIGFRVLVTGDAQRAQKRLEEDSELADCVLINGQNLGMEGVELLNDLSQSMYYELQSIPVVLLLTKEQNDLRQQAKTDDMHVVLQLPLTVKQLTNVFVQLLTNRAQKQEEREKNGF